MRRRPLLATAAALLAAALAAGPLGPAVAAAAPKPKKLTVGRLTLRPCKDAPDAWCGRLRVPLDRADLTAGTIPIGFEWYPAASARPAGTIVAMGGGPGYPSIVEPSSMRVGFRSVEVRTPGTSTEASRRNFARHARAGCVRAGGARGGR